MAKHSPKFESAKYVSSAEEQVMDDSCTGTISDERAAGKPESGQLSEEKQNFFNPYIPEIMDVFSDQDMDGYEKMHYMEGFRNFVAGGSDQYWVRADIEQGIDLVDPDDFHKSSVFLDVIRHSFRVDAEHTERTKTILRKYVDSVDKHKCNYLLFKKLNLVIESDHKNDLNINYINSPIPAGMQRYVMYDAWGVAHISDPKDYDLLQKLVPKTAQRTMKNPDYRNRFLETDWKPKTENFTEDDYEEMDRLWESHEDFLWRRGSDFEEIATKNYGFHKVSHTDIGISEKANGEVVDFSYFLSPEMVVLLHKEFEIDVRTIPLQERFHFLNYLKHTTVAEVETMQEFTRTHGVEGMRTFLALEQEGEHFGDEIVAFGTHEKAGEVFHSYNLLLDEADEVEALIRSEIECEENECEELVEKAHEKIFAQANQYLVSAIRANEEPENIDKISEEIGHARALAAAISVALSERKIKNVESLASFKQEVLTGEEANERELTEQLTSIYERNLKASGYSKESIEELKEKFAENLTKEHAQLYSWIVGERDVLSFVLVNEVPEQNSAFVSGLNVNPDIKASRGGVGLIHEVQAEYDKKGWTLHAVASPKNAEGYTHFGFVATAREESPDLDYKLKMAHHPDWNFRSREEGRGQLIAHLSESDVYRSADGNIVAWRTSDPTETPPQLGNGYVITQMFSKKQEGERTYYFILERFDAPELTSTHSTGPQRQNAA